MEFTQLIMGLWSALPLLRIYCLQGGSPDILTMLVMSFPNFRPVLDLVLLLLILDFFLFL